MNAVGTMGRGESHSAPLDRAALAVGSALVAWSQRRSARAAQPVDFDELMIRRAAEEEARRLMSERHAAANLPLFRVY
jgi:hypothetical protein